MASKPKEVYKTIKRSISATTNGTLSRLSNNLHSSPSNGSTPTKHWIHPPDVLLNGRVEYSVKMLGKTEVAEPKGTHVVKGRFFVSRFHLQVNKGVTGHSGSKLRKVDIQISVNGLNVLDSKSRAVLFKHPLHRISFCADDKQDKRVFSYIAKTDAMKHECFVFLSDKMAEKITLTIGEAFDLAYEKFIKKNGSRKELEDQKQIILLRKKVAELELENGKLKQQLFSVCPEQRSALNSHDLI
uniref:PID domain-containing protein n=1 Tax=Ditylenchus dipsaci TaxID=166011 RepID=A0A915CS56_9BILA